MSTLSPGTILLHPATLLAYVTVLGPAPAERIRLLCADAPGAVYFGIVKGDKHGPYVCLDGERATLRNRLRPLALPASVDRAVRASVVDVRAYAPAPAQAPRFTALTTQEWPGGSSIIGLGEDGRAYRYVHSDKAWHLVPTTLGQ